MQLVEWVVSNYISLIASLHLIPNFLAIPISFLNFWIFIYFYKLHGIEIKYKLGKEINNIKILTKYQWDSYTIITTEKCICIDDSFTIVHSIVITQL